MKTTRGRKPTDVTLRNIRATRKQVAALQELIKGAYIVNSRVSRNGTIE